MEFDFYFLEILPAIFAYKNWKCQAGFGKIRANFSHTPATAVAGGAATAVAGGGIVSH